MELKGKILLLMGGSAYASSIKKYAKEKEFQIVAVGNVADAPYHKIADKSYVVSTQDVDAIIEIVQQEHCDGIFVGASEVNIPPAMKVAEQTEHHDFCAGGNCLHQRVHWERKAAGERESLWQKPVWRTSEGCS